MPSSDWMEKNTVAGCLGPTTRGLAVGEVKHLGGVLGVRARPLRVARHRLVHPSRPTQLPADPVPQRPDRVGRPGVRDGGPASPPRAGVPTESFNATAGSAPVLLDPDVGDDELRARQRFAMPQKVLQRTFSTRFNDFALEFYSFVADNYAPFYSRPVECTDRDAPFVLDGVLYHESDLNLEEHYTINSR